MEIARAREILDPEHREPYESLEPINEACRMGVEALRRRVPESPYPDGDAGVMACPSCGSGEYLHNEDGNRCRFCGQKVRKALSALRMGLDARGMCARDRAGRTAETGEKFMLFLPIHEEERNTSAVGELPRSL